MRLGLARQRLTLVLLCLGQPKQAGAAPGGGGRKEAEEGFQRGSADEGAEPEGAPTCADIQVGIVLTPGQLSLLLHWEC